MPFCQGENAHFITVFPLFSPIGEKKFSPLLDPRPPPEAGLRPKLSVGFRSRFRRCTRSANPNGRQKRLTAPVAVGGSFSFSATSFSPFVCLFIVQ